MSLIFTPSFIKLRNENETKRNTTKNEETKRNEVSQNETKYIKQSIKDHRHSGTLCDEMGVNRDCLLQHK
jgi:transcriptional regulator with PAS, ATPase and Fis domain